MNKQTELLHRETVQDLTIDGLHYRLIPEQEVSPPVSKPIWRVRFTLISDSTRQFGLTIHDEIHLGRGIEAPNVVDLSPYDAETLGVSRRHLALRPTQANLFMVDLGSTNGTQRNGRSIGLNTPYALADGDVLSLGNLKLQIHFAARPDLHTTPLAQPLDLAEALSQIAKTITTQLNLDEVLNQIAATAMAVAAAGETSIWLLDETTGELFLEAQRGIDDTRLRRTRLPINDDSPAARVLRTGKPIRTNYRPGQETPQIMTGYLVEALVHVPIALGGVTFGVLAAAQQEPGKYFDDRDEKLLGAIADFAAIAIQNARLYQATDQALARRVDELAAINELSRAVSASLNLAQVYDVLTDQITRRWPVEAAEIFLVRGNKQDQSLRPLHVTSFEQVYPLNRGLVGAAARSGDIIISDDVANHAQFDPDLDLFKGKIPHSIACVPLLLKKNIIGVLALYNKEDKPFTEDDVSMLRAFTYPIATALENARLFEESEQRRAAMQAIAMTLSEPVIIIDEQGKVPVTNGAAQQLIEQNMSELFAAVSRSLGRTAEVQIGGKTYLSTTEHLPEIGTMVVMQDITYVKKLEEDRSEVMHMLSHDLKNPLMAISGYTGLLERTVELDEQGRRFINEINSASDRMLGMINQLLQTVIQDEAVHLARETCHLDTIVGEVLRDTEGAALPKSIQVQAQQKGKTYPIQGDSLRLYHMILNLVDNAIKYSPDDTAVDILCEYAENGVTIQVVDEGPGIPEKDLPHVFDKYYRGIQEGLPSSGSGVGLAAVKNIAEAHGGSVSVTNREPRGATFEITLPAKLRLFG